MQLLVWNNELFQDAVGLSFSFSRRARNVFLISNIFKLGEKKITQALGAVVFFFFFSSVLFMNGRTIFIFLISSDRTSGSPCVLLLWGRMWGRKTTSPSSLQLRSPQSHMTVLFFFFGSSLLFQRLQGRRNSGDREGVRCANGGPRAPRTPRFPKSTWQF